MARITPSARTAQAGAFAVAAAAGALACAVDFVVPRAHAPAIVAGVLVAAVFVGAGYAIGFWGRLEPRQAALPIALAAAVYVGGAAALAPERGEHGEHAKSIVAAAPAIALGAAIAVFGMVAGLNGGRRRRERSEAGAQH